MKTFNLPIKFFAAQAGIQPGENPEAPPLGRDTVPVLQRLLGLKPTEIERLQQAKVIWT